MKEILDQVQAAWSALSLKQRISIALSAIVTFLAVGAIVWWAQQPDWTVLATGLDGRQAQEVIEELDSQSVPHRLTDGGKTIEVPAARLNAARMNLRAKGIGGDTGFDFSSMLESKDVGRSVAMERRIQQRALEGELGKTIESLDKVRWARVHLVLPGERVFVDDDQVAKASVTVGLNAGATLNSQESQAIVGIVAGAVPQLEPENVRLADQNGKIFSVGEEGVAGGGSQQLEMRTAMERNLNQKATRVLEALVGPGRFRVQSTVDLNLDRVQRREETYDPDSGVLISESKRKERSQSDLGAEGIPGTASNLPGAAARGGAAGERSETSETLSNFQYSRVDRFVQEESGSVERLSVSVVVDYADPPAGSESGQPLPRSDEEIDRIVSLIESAIGFDEDRGDVVSVSQAPFVAPPVVAPPRTFDWREYLPYVRYPALVLILLMVFLLFFRPLMRTLREAFASADKRREQMRVDFAEPSQLGSPSRLELMRQRLTKLASEHPDGMAQTMRVWLHEPPKGP